MGEKSEEAMSNTSVKWNMVHSSPSFSPQQAEWGRQPCNIPKIGVNAGSKTISARQPDVWSASLCWNRKSDVSGVPDQQRVMLSRFQSMWSPVRRASPPPEIQWLQLHSDYWTYFKRYYSLSTGLFQLHLYVCNNYYYIFLDSLTSLPFCYGSVTKWRASYARLEQISSLHSLDCWYTHGFHGIS